MFVVGLTGGIGSGKTAASNRFNTLGISIVDADLASRSVVELRTLALSEIAQYFGHDILLVDGNLNRALLRQKIFSNPEHKAWLEALLHPLIAEEIKQGIQSASSPYVIFVSPLLIESGQMQFCQRLLVIDVPESIQLERTATRDNNNKPLVARIIASQASREQRLDQADDVIDNTQGIIELENQVDKLHQRYLSLASQSTN